MKTIGLLLAEGFEEIEAVTVADVLRRGNVDVKLVSVTGKLAVTGAHGIAVICEALLDKEKLLAMDGVVLPGGMPGTVNLQKNSEVLSVLTEFNKSKKLICAICAAPMVLGEMGLLKGHTATCYPGFENSLKGAEYTGGAWCSDGNFITGKGPGLAMIFALKILEALEGKKKSEEIKNDLLFDENKI